MVSEMSSVTEAEAAAGYIKPVLANNEVKKKIIILPRSLHDATDKSLSGRQTRVTHVKRHHANH